MIINLECLFVVPCYNEEDKFQMAAYIEFLNAHPQVHICLVNDGSSDGTLRVINNLHDQFPNQTNVLDLEINGGKAEAVRMGMLYGLKNVKATYYAFIDADLAISLEEGYGFVHSMEGAVKFCFASRIMKLGSNIARNTKRFIISRILATFISNILELKVYDTQCGCKMFSSEMVAGIFSDKFISKWLFDVEIFFRIMINYGREEAMPMMLEMPLKTLRDTGGSKIRASYFFKIFSDLYAIRKKYKKRSMIA